MTARSLLRVSGKRGIGWATFAASVAAICSILLLALSGWFLTAAAIAGAGGATAAFAFNYLIPSATIRLLALLRTGSRYGERLLSHRAALLAMAELRGTMFRTLAGQDGRRGESFAGGDASARLLGDIDSLEDVVIREPGRLAGLVAVATSVALAAFAGWRAALTLTVLLAILPVILRILSGWMHNNLRMYWGKRIIAMTPSPEAAWATACYLNDRLSLDGRDPSTYGNIAQMFGGGAPGREAAVYGRVPMRSDGSTRHRPDGPEWIAAAAARPISRIDVPVDPPVDPYLTGIPAV